MYVGLYQAAVLNLLTSDDENVLLRQYMARLLNTFASINEGNVLNCQQCDLLTHCQQMSLLLREFENLLRLDFGTL